MLARRGARDAGGRVWPREDAIKVPIKDAWKFRMGMPHFLVFQCSSCLAQRATVTLETGMRGSEGIVLKVGQSPQIRTPVNPRVAKAMGGALGLFRQGLTSEAHGFGIGAYAYYRQVAENLVDSLVKQLRTEAEALQFKELIDAIDRLAPRVARDERGARPRRDPIREKGLGCGAVGRE